MATRILHGFQILNSFQSVSTEDHSYEIWLKLAQWFKDEISFKEIVDRQMDYDDDNDNNGL